MLQCDIAYVDDGIEINLQSTQQFGSGGIFVVYFVGWFAVY